MLWFVRELEALAVRLNIVIDNVIEMKKLTDVQENNFRTASWHSVKILLNKVHVIATILLENVAVLLITDAI